VAPPVLATVWRGSVCEAVVRGHVAIVDGSDRLVASAGEPGSVTTLRSCVKPIQALPFARLAMASLGASPSELAVACASHNGEEEHVRTVLGLLARAGVGETALSCGPQLPFDEESARRLLASGASPAPIHNNCSGKHAAMLATCAVMGWPLEGYAQPGHPCQQAVTAALSEFLGDGLAHAPWGIDGCGLPTYGLPLSGVARGFASAAADSDFRACQDAMAAHPHLVAGTARFDTAVLAAAGADVTVKIGGAAVWAAVVRPDGPGIAIKLEAGAGEAMPAVAVAVLRQLGVLPDPLPRELEPFERPIQRNWAGAAVGEIRAEPPL